MSFNIEYCVSVTAISIRAVSMSLRAFFKNVAVVSETASMLEQAIAEGMNNVLEHAYDGDCNGEMRIVVRLDGLLLQVSIFDKGKEPNLERVSSIPELPQVAEDSPLTTELVCEGRGLFIMESLMDSLHYQRVGDENCLIMTKKF